MAKSKKKEVSQAAGLAPGSVPNLEAELTRVFDRRWPRLFDWSPSRVFADLRGPNVDVLDRESEVLVKAELPGFKKDEIDVSVSDHTMTIKASTSSETEKDEDGDYYVKEISRDFVSRTLRLPADVVGENARAKYKDGILEVTVPKATGAKRQRVEVES